MEPPGAGSATRRKVVTQPLIRGGPGLKLGDGGASPLLEAHPGPPVDPRGHRPSIAASLPPARSCGSELDPRSPRSPRLEGRVEEFKGGGVAAKKIPLSTPTEETTMKGKHRSGDCKSPRESRFTLQPRFLKKCRPKPHPSQETMQCLLMLLRKPVWWISRSKPTTESGPRPLPSLMNHGRVSRPPRPSAL